MRNDVLNHVILKNLELVREVGLRQKALQCAVEIDMDRQDLTTAEFQEALNFLEDQKLVEKSTNFLGEAVYMITKNGRGALKGL